MWAPGMASGDSQRTAALVAFDTVNKDGQRLIDRSLLNVVFALMLTTSILGPVLTERLTPGMLEAEEVEKTATPQPG